MSTMAYSSEPLEEAWKLSVGASLHNVWLWSSSQPFGLANCARRLLPIQGCPHCPDLSAYHLPGRWCERSPTLDVSSMTWVEEG